MVKKYEVFESNSAITLLRTTESLQNKASHSNLSFKLKHLIFKKDDPFLMQPRVVSNVIISKRHILIESNPNLQENVDYLDKKFNHIGFLFLQEPEKDLETFSVFLESEIKSLKKQMTLEYC